MRVRHFLKTLEKPRTKTQYQMVLYLLISMHLAGLLGLQFAASRTLFEALVPFNLLATCGFLLYFHQDWNKAFFYFCGLSFLIGFGVEVLGVQSKVIFGNYEYAHTLGVKLLGVPLLIGVNWLVLIYVTGDLIEQFLGRFSIFFKAFLAALLMVVIDYFIEPVAIRHHFWVWLEGKIPLQNYIAWFLVSYILLLIFYRLPFQKQNHMSIPIYGVQLAFFVIQYIISYFILS